MIDLRHHVASLVAVLVALAVGVTLGAGPLRDPVTAVASTEDLQERAEVAAAERDRARAAVATLDTAAADLAAQVAAGALEDTTVLLVALPGAAASQLARLQSTLIETGGEVTGTLRLTREWVDPARGTFRSALAAQVEPLLVEGGAVAPAGGDTALLGAGLGTALLVPPDGTDAPSAGTVGTVLGVLTGGELGALEPAAPPPADVALVVAGPLDDTVTADGWVDVVAGLASRGPVVVAEDVVPVAATGVAPAPDVPSVVVRLRQRAAEEPGGTAARASSVDTLGADVGRWATVLAVAGAAAGGQGGYGLLDTADGPVPSPG